MKGSEVQLARQESSAALQPTECGNIANHIPQPTAFMKGKAGSILANQCINVTNS
jgi:hypothetical protein